MTKIRVCKQLGPLAMAIFLILFGLSMILGVSSPGMVTLMGVLALIAGGLGLLELE
jgi:hypothetical protein